MNIELLNVRIYIQKNESSRMPLGIERTLGKITTLAMPPLVLKLGKSPPMPVL
jgi:hypothetical protein